MTAVAKTGGGKVGNKQMDLRAETAIFGDAWDLTSK
jgi:hypothetical protein